MPFQKKIKIEETINIFKNKLSVIEVLHDHLSCSFNFLNIQFLSRNGDKLQRENVVSSKSFF